MIQKTLDDIYRLAVSTHDLKPSGTSIRNNACDLGFTACEIFAKKARADRRCPQRIPAKEYLQNNTICRVHTIHAIHTYNEYIQ